MDKSVYAKIANNIRKYRKFNKLTQEVMAEKMGLDSQYYAQLEQGRRNFTIEKVIDSCNILHVKIEDVVPTISFENQNAMDEKKNILIANISSKLANASVKDLILIEKFIDDFISVM